MNLSDITILLLCAVGLLILAERLWRERIWRRQETSYREQIRTLSDMRDKLDTSLQQGKKRKKELEYLVLELVGRLEKRDLSPEDKQLLADIYHEYGTESHAFYFGAHSS